MTDRRTLFLVSLGVILAALGVAAWLIHTGQTAYIDGLFLLLCCLALVLAFGLYARYLVRSAMQAAAPPAEPAKITVAIQQKPGLVRVPAMQLAGKDGDEAKVGSGSNA